MFEAPRNLKEPRALQLLALEQHRHAGHPGQRDARPQRRDAHRPRDALPRRAHILDRHRRGAVAHASMFACAWGCGAGRCVGAGGNCGITSETALVAVPVEEGAVSSTPYRPNRRPHRRWSAVQVRLRPDTDVSAPGATSPTGRSWGSLSQALSTSRQNTWPEISDHTNFIATGADGDIAPHRCVGKFARRVTPASRLARVGDRACVVLARSQSSNPRAGWSLESAVPTSVHPNRRPPRPFRARRHDRSQARVIAVKDPDGASGRIQALKQTGSPSSVSAHAAS